ncbi:MAG: hypothetical protein U0800_01085 [Isosphaeraceae bacterium]
MALANDTPYAITLDTALRIPDGLPIEDLGRGTLIEGDGENGLRRLAIDLPTSGVVGLRMKATAARVASAAPRYSEAVQAQLDAQSRDLSVRLSRLSKPAEPSPGGPPNPGFEPEGPRNGEIRVVRNARPGRLEGGRRRLARRRDRPQDAPFGPGQPPHRLAEPARLGRQRNLRAAAGAVGHRPVLAPVRPGRRAGPVPHRRGSGRPTAGPPGRTGPGGPGANTSVKLPDIPPNGLDRAKIRFELLGLGQVWVDDLTLAGGGPTEGERLIARRRTILAAVQAYREHRLADFARLAGSHWVRPIPSDPDAEPTTPAARSTRVAGPDGPTTDLPAGRRLR